MRARGTQKGALAFSGLRAITLGIVTAAGSLQQLQVPPLMHHPQEAWVPILHILSKPGHDVTNNTTYLDHREARVVRESRKSFPHLKRRHLGLILQNLEYLEHPERRRRLGIFDGCGIQPAFEKLFDLRFRRSSTAAIIDGQGMDRVDVNDSKIVSPCLMG